MSAFCSREVLYSSRREFPPMLRYERLVDFSWTWDFSSILFFKVIPQK